MNSVRALAIHAAAAVALSAPAAFGAVLLDTTLDGTTVSSKTLNNITYATEVGLDGPTSITGSATLFSTNLGDTDGHYAPNAQVNNSQWDVDIVFAVTGDDVQLDTVKLERQHFNTSAAFNTATGKTYPIIVTLTGSVSGQVAQDTVDPDPWPSPNAVESFDMGSVVLSSSETWTLNIQVNDGGATNSGIYVGFDGYTFEGAVIPEPTSLALLGLGGLLIGRRRR